MRRPRDVDFIGLLSAALNVEDREVALSVKITRPVELPPGFCQVYVSIDLISGVRAPFVKHYPREDFELEVFEFRQRKPDHYW